MEPAMVVAENGTRREWSGDSRICARVMEYGYGAKDGLAETRRSVDGS